MPSPNVALTEQLDVAEVGVRVAGRQDALAARVMIPDSPEGATVRLPAQPADFHLGTADAIPIGIGFPLEVPS